MSQLKEIVTSLLNESQRFRQREIDVEGLKAVLWIAEQQVTGYEDRLIRRMLQQAEGELDSIQFTTDTDGIFSEVVKVLDRLEASLVEVLH